MQRIAFLGKRGSNSFAMAHQLYADSAEYVSCPTFDHIFKAVLSHAADVGLIPIENTITGSVHENYDLLHKHAVTITAENIMKIRHHLLGIPVSGVRMHDREIMIRKVISHPQGLMQCNNYLSRHPWMERIAFNDTAGAAMYVSEQQNPTIAAIGNADSAELHNLEIIREHIADTIDENYTRFFTIAKPRHAPHVFNKCSLLFAVQHKPGSLYSVIQHLSGYNMTKIESRPIHGKPFEYLFYIDFEKDGLNMNEVHAIVHAISSDTQFVKILGHYKSAETYE